MPSSPSRPDRLRALVAKPFAHRGLHGEGRIENSRAAFEAAIAAGHGIELDVRAIEIGWPIVFHDETLDRLTERRGPVAALELEEVHSIRLRGSLETIPMLGDILDLVAGRVPLLIEIKSRSPDPYQLCYHVGISLFEYPGPVAVMSFNPRVGRFFSRHFPEVLRGLVVSEQDKPHLQDMIERRVSRWWARPDFLACDIRDLPSRFAASSGLPVLTWTVRGEADRARAADHADQIIFEEMPG